MSQKIKTCLWFDNNAEEAVNLYTSLFKDSKIHHTSLYGDGWPGPKGSVMTIDFELRGQTIRAGDKVTASVDRLVKERWLTPGDARRVKAELP
jgi:predicted 3-demethylubiquinone-9 3-methyltransferase (glyoxalase superfamily)